MGRRSKITVAKLEKMTSQGRFALGILLTIIGVFGIIIISCLSSQFDEIVWYFYLLIIPDLLFGIFLLVSSIAEMKNEKEYEEKLSKSNIDEVDKMQGYEFEIFLKTLFEKLGYSAEVTKKSGDYGADIILYRNNATIVVQAKRYEKHVGVKAVQEIYSSKNYYCANEAWVVTNNYFTRQAKELANNNGVRLINREELVDLIFKTK